MLDASITMGSLVAENKFCWVTLVTKPAYLPGAIILAHSLNKYHSRYQLLVLYTDSLGPQAINTLAAEEKRTNRIRLHHVDLLLPREEQKNIGKVLLAQVSR